VTDRTVVVIQARMTSSRLPGKVLAPLAGRPLLAWVIDRARAIPGVDAVCVAAPEGSEHDPIAELVAACGLADVFVARGSETDVLARTVHAAESASADTILRITSDCPFLDPAVSGAVLAMYRGTGVSYAATAMESGFPVGMDTEVLSMGALRAAAAAATDDYEREHVTPYIWRRPEQFPTTYLERRPSLRHWRLVVDTPEDYELACAVYDELAPENPLFDLRDIARLLSERPEIAAINGHVEQTPYEWKEAV